VPCPLIGKQLTNWLVIDEMFRERIVHWARILDLFTCTMSAIIVLTKVRAGALLFARTNQSKLPAYSMRIDSQRELAMAYVRLASLNR
jgi:hypothetical protein